jgi:hypothetical protein
MQQAPQSDRHTGIDAASLVGSAAMQITSLDIGEGAIPAIVRARGDPPVRRLKS